MDVETTNNMLKLLTTNYLLKLQLLFTHSLWHSKLLMEDNSVRHLNTLSTLSCFDSLVKRTLIFLSFALKIHQKLIEKKNGQKTDQLCLHDVITSNLLSLSRADKIGQCTYSTEVRFNPLFKCASLHIITLKKNYGKRRQISFYICKHGLARNDDKRAACITIQSVYDIQQFNRSFSKCMKCNTAFQIILQ